MCIGRKMEDGSVVEYGLASQFLGQILRAKQNKTKQKKTNKNHPNWQQKSDAMAASWSLASLGVWIPRSMYGMLGTLG